MAKLRVKLQKRGAGRHRDVEPTAMQLRYMQNQIDHPEWADRRCADEAGYSPKSPVGVLNRQVAVRDIRDEIRDAKMAAGLNIEVCMKRLKKTIAREESESDIAANGAVKVFMEMSGDRMPERIQVGIEKDEDLLAKLVGL